MLTTWFGSVLISALLSLSPAPHQPAQGNTEHFSQTRLTALHVVEDVPCGAGLLWTFEETGHLHRCTLDHDAIVRGAALPKGSIVAFHADGTHEFVFLPHDTTIEGHVCKGAGDGFMTTFHPNGRLKLCWLPDDATIQGVGCAGFSVWSDLIRRNQSGVTFHDNGQLAGCRLSQSIKQDGVTLKKGEHIRLDPNGHLVPPGGA